MTLSDYSRKLACWYDQREFRERVLVLICLLAVLFFVWDSLVISPLAARKKQLDRKHGELQSELAELSSRETLILARQDNDPDFQSKKQLEQLRNEIARVNMELESRVEDLISPQEMPDLLQRLLQEQRGLQLSSLANQPAEVIRMTEEQ